jgi:hypothetical protein
MMQSFGRCPAEQEDAIMSATDAPKTRSVTFNDDIEPRIGIKLNPCMEVRHL